MTDLLAPTSEPTAPPPSPASRRPLASAAAAGAAAPTLALLLLWVLGLAAWYSSDGGSHGNPRDVLRLGADAWLLAHGADLELLRYSVTAAPLGLTVVCAYLTHRAGRWAGAAAKPADLRSVGVATAALAGAYAVVSVIVALLASVPEARPSPFDAVAGGAVLGALAGGTGLLRGSGLGPRLRRWVPLPLLSAGYGAVAISLGCAAAGLLLTGTSLAVHGAAAAAVLSSLDAGVTGSALCVLVVALLAPNAALLAGAYLLGPGFAMGAGTVVSVTQVELEAVPAVPLLAALPGNGPAPAWATALLGVPVLLALGGGFLGGRAVPTRSYRAGAGRGLATGTLAAVTLTLAVTSAGGGIGPGRMQEVGTPATDLLAAAVPALAPAALVGALLAVWWVRRRHLPEAEAPDLHSVTDWLRSLRASAAGDDPASTRPGSSAAGGPLADLSTEQTVRFGVDQSRHQDPGRD